MYQQGDKMLEVRELLVKAFATAWKNSDQSTDRDTYINSSITVIDSMQVQPEMIYAEEGQGLTDVRRGAGPAPHRGKIPERLRRSGGELFYCYLDAGCRSS